MKNFLGILFIFVILGAIFSCRNSTDEPQQIDQIVNIYIDSANQNMFNTAITGSYTTVALKDIGGIYDQVSINSGYSVKTDANSNAYLEYVYGATRNLIDSTSATKKTYESDMVLNLTKTVNSKSKTSIDTMKIQYSWTPQLFQVSKIYYKGKLVFTKTPGTANTFKIVK